MEENLKLPEQLEIGMYCITNDGLIIKITMNDMPEFPYERFERLATTYEILVHEGLIEKIPTAEEFLAKYQKAFDDNGIVFTYSSVMRAYARMHIEMAHSVKSYSKHNIK